MLRKILIPLVCCAVLGGAAWFGGAPSAHAQLAPLATALTADPTSEQIYDAARAGRLAQAQQMIDQVLRNHPDSAKAHYVAAEVYARSGDLVRARRELDEARGIDPALSFAQPSAVAQLTQQLASGRYVYGAPYGVPVVRRAHTISWGGIVLVVAGIALIFALLRRRSVPYGQPFGQYPGANGPYAGGPYGPQYPGAGPYGAPMMGGGPGLMGSLATGLAVGAGVAAGEELVQHMTGGAGAAGAAGTIVPSANAGELPPDMQNADMGGNDFGLTDGSSWDSGGGDPFGGGSDMGGGDWGGGGGGDWT